MPHDYHTICEFVAQAVSETLEAMVFAEAIPTESEPAAPWSPTALWVHLPIVTPVQGRLTLFCPEDLAVELAQNLYGMDAGQTPDADTLRDTLAELTNTIAGRFMDKVTPAGQAFELGLPESGAGETDSADNAVRCLFTVDQRLLMITVSGVF